MDDGGAGWAATTAEVWDVLKGSATALLTILDVRGRLGLRGEGRATVDSVTDALANLDEEGYIETWEVDPPVVILSSHAAEGLGLTLSDDGRKWEAVTKKTKPLRLKRRAKLRNEAETGVSQSKRQDPTSPDPNAPAGDNQGPARVLLGEGLIWRGPAWCRGRPCPACSGDRGLAARLEGVKGAGHWLAELKVRTCLLCSARVAERQDPRRRDHVSKSDQKRIMKGG